MIGKVDDRNRALIDLEVRRTPNSQQASVKAWIDTAFDGHLVFPLPLIQELELQSLVDTEAILADGKKVILETFSSPEVIRDQQQKAGDDPGTDQLGPH